MSRPERLSDFLAGTAWAGARRQPLTGDASLRRYERLQDGPSPALLVDAPPPEDTALFVRMAGWLRDQGLLAPTIHQADEEAGFLVVEDLGDSLLAQLCHARPEQEKPLYTSACDELLRLQRARVPAFLPAYDDDFFLFEIGIFTEWAAGSLTETARADLLALWTGILPLARVGADVVIHRDFHALNLIQVGERFALIDFQGARIGPAAYDLISLLVDARRDVADDAAAAVAMRYLETRPELDRDAFAAACAIMAAQRTTKILGLFRRLAKRDGKPAYLDLLPRVQGQLEQALAHPVLAPIRDWHGRHGFGS
ncbi:aminoglycoside phosphotransferase family protein [Geminicoccus roseus]|uniref:aminoglycoside phosphotransferase family protein n=1 Tax=Geminicoccus roseus TaxID=404900 RepID=UPI000411E002|nr:phosphotransferase [Geminicoccus roseus]